MKALVLRLTLLLAAPAAAQELAAAQPDAAALVTQARALGAGEPARVRECLRLRGEVEGRYDAELRALIQLAGRELPDLQAMLREAREALSGPDRAALRDALAAGAPDRVQGVLDRALAPIARRRALGFCPAGFRYHAFGSPDALRPLEQPGDCVAAGGGDWAERRDPAEVRQLYWHVDGSRALVTACRGQARPRYSHEGPDVDYVIPQLFHPVCATTDPLQPFSPGAQPLDAVFDPLAAAGDVMPARFVRWTGYRYERVPAVLPLPRWPEFLAASLSDEDARRCPELRGDPR